jgi:catechol 1,2-dioxygenase
MVSTPEELTQAVLAEMQHAQQPRTREIFTAMVKHLHAFVKEVQLTEIEFQQAIQQLARLGQMTNASHNEVALACGSLGISSLVCLINNQVQESSTTANLMGPFWRPNAPFTEQGASIVRSHTPGESVWVELKVVDQQGNAIQGAEVDVWQCSSEGFYENQDPDQADMNLRGKFKTVEKGLVKFWTIKPVGYPVPLNGPVGDMLKLLGRHNMRPAHIHFMVHLEGFKTQFSQIYSADDPCLHSDVQFGVTEALVAHYEPQTQSADPAAGDHQIWYKMKCQLVLLPGSSQLPRAPISGKATGPRPELNILQARHDIQRQ